MQPTVQWWMAWTWHVHRHCLALQRAVATQGPQSRAAARCAQHATSSLPLLLVCSKCMLRRYMSCPRCKSGAWQHDQAMLKAPCLSRRGVHLQLQCGVVATAVAAAVAVAVPLGAQRQQVPRVRLRAQAVWTRRVHRATASWPLRTLRMAAWVVLLTYALRSRSASLRWQQLVEWPLLCLQNLNAALCRLMWGATMVQALQLPRCSVPVRWHMAWARQLVLT